MSLFGGGLPGVGGGLAGLVRSMFGDGFFFGEGEAFREGKDKAAIGLLGAPQEGAEEPDISEMIRLFFQQEMQSIMGQAPKTAEEAILLQDRLEQLQQGSANIDVIAAQLQAGPLADFLSDPNTSSEQAVAAALALIQEGVTPEDDEFALSPEAEEFQALQLANQRLDTQILQEDLTSRRMANAQAGMLTLLNLIPSKARAAILPDLLADPRFQAIFFPEMASQAQASTAPRVPDPGPIPEAALLNTPSTSRPPRVKSTIGGKAIPAERPTAPSGDLTTGAPS